jgi:uncharacterized protein YkwD
MPGTPVRHLALAAIAGLLAACGGSGGSPTDPGGGSDAQAESRSFELLNQARRDQGVQPELAFDPQLAEVARAYSRAMRDRGFFSHIDPEGHDFVFRLQQGGVASPSGGEGRGEGETQPLTTPIGRSWATLRLMPARWTTSTTSATSL